MIAAIQAPTVLELQVVVGVTLALAGTMLAFALLARLRRSGA